MAKKSWIGHNNKVFQKAISDKKAYIEKRVLSILGSVAEDIYKDIENTTYNQGDGYMPYYTGNLRDSTGLGIYYDGALGDLFPPKAAEEPQNYWQAGYFFFDLWGFEFVRTALSETNNFNEGIWIVLYSTMPYARHVDESGSTYWDAGWFSENIVQRQLLPKLKTAFAREFPNIAKQMNI